MEHHQRIRARALAGACVVGMMGAVVVTQTVASAEPAAVTRGALTPFAAGTGTAISGHAQMVRTASGSTIVTLHVEGLAAGGRYASHVHAAPCAVGAADGHYKLDPAGPATPPNEIWPGAGPFVANGGGIANAQTVAGFTAGPTAVSVVVHDLSLPSTANKVACADLG
ncbi:MAG: hypothetical protein JJE46_08125 [Acidimicrobiia bacterium]|nr:hypothetical protein [Acidimicrobiia bacterium]